MIGTDARDWGMQGALISPALKDPMVQSDMQYFLSHMTGEDAQTVVRIFGECVNGGKMVALAHVLLYCNKVGVRLDGSKDR